jgi:hypothetical protein
MIGPMDDLMQRMDTCIKKVIEDEINVYKRKNIYYAETPDSLKLNGCQMHPSVAEDSIIAKKLIKDISEATGWDSEHISDIHKQMLYKHTDTFSIRKIGSTIRFTMSSNVQPVNVSVTNLLGIVIKLGMISANRNFVWNIENVPSGIYILNCAELNVSKKILIKKR